MENPQSTCQIFNANCLEKMKDIPDNSVDLIFNDLPYQQTSCKWDIAIDMDLYWKQVMRIKKLNTPIFFTTTTKFGVSLIQSAPKKCFFRYDLVWVKSAPAGFLCAKKMPMRKHEMVYVFYEKLPFYDLSSHQHKFIKHKENTAEESKAETYGKLKRCVGGQVGSYDPPLPVSVVKEEGCYGEKVPNSEAKYGQKCARQYDPPLRVSVVKEEFCKYDVNKNAYGGGKENRIKISKNKKDHEAKYDPPLPVSVVKEEEKQEGIYGTLPKTGKSKEAHSAQYDPPLPTTMLEIKSTRGKHSTEKPVALMEWIFKYYSKEGDTILDPTMGSGSTGVACKNMNRNFIGIEMDEEIFKVAEKRLS
jgi:16S rRNA G966 N2-methylase RsmD